MTYEITILRKYPRKIYPGFYFEAETVSEAVLVSEFFFHRWTGKLKPEDKALYYVSFPTPVGGFVKQSFVLRPFQLREKCKAIDAVRQFYELERRKKQDQEIRNIIRSLFAFAYSIYFDLSDFIRGIKDQLIKGCKGSCDNKTSITKLFSFYLLDNKLLYISEHFVGFDPAISVELPRTQPEYNGRSANETTFNLNGHLFTAKMNSFIAGGPIRGETKIEIFKNDMPFFTYIHGSKGYGHVYGTGIEHIFDGDCVNLLQQGRHLSYFKGSGVFSDLNPESYYFLCFKAFAIPQLFPAFQTRGTVPEDKSNKTYALSELEQYRKEILKARLRTSNYELHISETVIKGFIEENNKIWVFICRDTADLEAGKIKFIPSAGSHNEVKPQIIITVNGTPHVLEKYGG